MTTHIMQAFVPVLLASLKKKKAWEMDDIEGNVKAAWKAMKVYPNWYLSDEEIMTAQNQITAATEPKDTPKNHEMGAMAAFLDVDYELIFTTLAQISDLQQLKLERIPLDATLKHLKKVFTKPSLQTLALLHSTPPHVLKKMLPFMNDMAATHLEWSLEEADPLLGECLQRLPSTLTSLTLSAPLSAPNTLLGCLGDLATRLQHLGLPHCQLSDSSSVNPLFQVPSLNLSGNLLSHLPTQTFTALTALDLSGQVWDVHSLHHFLELNPQITSLNISHCQIDDIQVAKWKWPNLKELDVSHNLLRQLPTSFTTLTSLQTLHMDGCVLESLQVVCDLAKQGILERVVGTQSTELQALLDHNLSKSTTLKQLAAVLPDS